MTGRDGLPFAADYHHIKIASLRAEHPSVDLIIAFLNHLEEKPKNTARIRNLRARSKKFFILGAVASRLTALRKPGISRYVGFSRLVGRVLKRLNLPTYFFANPKQNGPLRKYGFVMRNT